MLHEITVSIVGYERAGGAERDTGVKSKNTALCNCIVASCNIGLVVLIQIALLWEDLSAVSLSNGQSQFFWIEIVHRQISQWVRRGTPYELCFS